MTHTLTHNASCCEAPTLHDRPETLRFSPRCDIRETADEVVLYADLPGAAPETLDIQFEKGELTIQAAVAERQQDARRIRNEYGVGDYHRVFSVAETINADAITAQLHNGVLTVHLPKAEAVKPHRIQIQS